MNLYNNEFSELSKELTPLTIQDFKFSKWAFKELRTTIELLEEGKNNIIVLEVIRHVLNQDGLRLFH